MKILSSVLSIIYPNNCAFCKTGMPHSDSGVYICGECMKKLVFCINTERCVKCGAPLDNPKYKLCGDCYKMRKSGETVYYDRITAPLEYDDNAKNAIVYLKNGRYLGAVGTFCALIEMMIKNDFAGEKIDIVVSVPPRRGRMRKIGFDQAEIIAEGLAPRIGTKYIRGSLKRVRKTRKQSELSRRERLMNLSGAFALRKPAELFRGKTILVADDVCTTGATMNECARVLKQAGAAKVFCAAIARTGKNSKT